MKVALLTIWRIENYGAELQTYATVKALKEMGCEVEVINFPINERKKQSIKDRIIKLLMYCTPSSIEFHRFWRKNIPSTKRCYYSGEELRQNPPIADVYLVGSDQVWNPSITKERCLSFFLDFTDNDSKRISYASSFGVSKWSYDMVLTSQIREYLNRFNAVSCREIEGVSILTDVFSVNAEIVLDPTLLFERYPELSGPISENKSLAFYSIFNNQPLQSLALDIAKKRGLLFRNANETSFWLKGHVWKRPSIGAWIKTIGEARFVVTDSFHGTVLSILYQRQFIVVYKGTKSSRITSLLSRLSLLDYYFESVELAKEGISNLGMIDYSIVQPLLLNLREQSRSFLYEAVCGTKE